MFPVVFERCAQALVNNAPTLLKPPVKLCPKSVQTQLIAQVLNHLFAAAIADDEFEFLSGRWVNVEIKDIELVFFVGFDGKKLLVKSHRDDAALTFAAILNDMVLLLGRIEDPDTLFFQRRLTIEGDTEMGLEVKNLMDSIDFDAWPASVKNATQQFSAFISKYQTQSMTAM